jgi:hypothetical protein
MKNNAPVSRDDGRQETHMRLTFALDNPLAADPGEA